MKVALVTTPPSVRSGIGDYTRHLLPYLREHCEVQIFVEQDLPDQAWEGESVRTVADLDPRAFDQVLFQLGNEQSHGFMAKMIRAIGGTVMQHDWVLFDLAMHAWPALVRGGAKGHMLALREGGLEQARLYSRNWLDRRRQRNRAEASVDAAALEGTLISGWYDPEGHGRWTTDKAYLRIPSDSVEHVEIDFHADPPRTVRVRENGQVLAEGRRGTLSFRPEGERPLLLIETSGITVTKEQRQHGDSRRLGSFVQCVRWKGRDGDGELDLFQPCAVPSHPITLSRDRFDLALNRSIVRFADAFIVHSNYLKERILKERNAATPIGIVHHGAERRWRDDDRRETRARLGLEPDWVDSFLVTSFGGVQPHKRVDKALRALAQARRERPDIRMVLAGSLQSSGFDPRALAKYLGIDDAVHFTGFVPEELAWDWLHAGDISLNLRGPTTGGTSGGLFQAFSMKRPVIASDAAEQKELPDSCVLKIPFGEEEVPTLTRTFVSLRDDPERRRELERAVEAFVDDECHWSIVARRYAEHMESFPPARVARRRLVSLRLALGR